MTISANVEISRPDAETSRYAKWAIALFFVTLFIPGSLYIGVRMTPYRLYLLAMAVPMLLRFREDPTLRVTVIDALVFFAIFWRVIAMIVNHQTSEIVNAASLFVELFFGYMLGRVFIRSAADYRFFFKCFLFTLLAFLPFALIEAVTRQRILRALAGIVLTQPPDEISSSAHVRFGLLRVQASFEHALLYGTFCAVGFANAYYIYKDRFPLNWVLASFVAFMTFLAISSSSILTLLLQGCLMVYETVLRPLKQKWILLGVSSILLWFLFELIFQKTIPEYVISELVINQTGAEGRLDQIRFGMLEIYRDPFFGLGLDPPALPFWRGNAIDNFWLLTALRYGVPALVLIALAFLGHLIMVTTSRAVRPEDLPLRVGYAISFVTLMLIIGSLSLWGVIVVFILVYVGAGAWFYDAPPARPASGAVRPAAERRTPPPGGIRQAPPRMPSSARRASRSEGADFVPRA